MSTQPKSNCLRDFLIILCVFSFFFALLIGGAYFLYKKFSSPSEPKTKQETTSSHIIHKPDAATRRRSEQPGNRIALPTPEPDPVKKPDFGPPPVLPEENAKKIQKLPLLKDPPKVKRQTTAPKTPEPPEISKLPSAPVVPKAPEPPVPPVNTEVFVEPELPEKPEVQEAPVLQAPPEAGPEIPMDEVKAPERIQKQDNSLMTKDEFLEVTAKPLYHRDEKSSPQPESAVEPIQKMIDIVHLKNKHQLDGKITGRTNSLVIMENDGIAVEIKQSEIIKIEHIPLSEWRQRHNTEEDEGLPEFTAGQEIIIITYDDQIIQGTILKHSADIIELLLDEGTYIIKRKNIKMIERK